MSNVHEQIIICQVHDQLFTCWIMPSISLHNIIALFSFIMVQYEIILLTSNKKGCSKLDSQ